MSRTTTFPTRIEAHLQAKLHAMFVPMRLASTGNAEAVHEMRVASRRLRIALRYFAALFPASELRQIQRHLRRTTRTLGEIRSLDVNLKVLHKAAKQLPVSTIAVQRKLTGELLALRHERLNAGRELLQTFVTSRFEARIRALILKPRAIDDHRLLAEAQDFTGKLRRQLRRRLKNCREEEPGEAAFHKLRVSAKRYRYSLETSMAVFRTEAAEVVGEIKALQDCLGAWHDLEELLGFLRSCRRQWTKADNPLAGRLTGVLTFFQGAGEAAFADLQKFLRDDYNWHKKIKLKLPHD